VVWAINFQFDSTIDGKAAKIASMINEHTRESLLNIMERSIARAPPHRIQEGVRRGRRAAEGAADGRRTRTGFARAALLLREQDRSLDQAVALDVTAKGFCDLALEKALELRGDLEAVNTKDNPDRIRPAPLDGVTIEADRLRATLAPASWNVIRLGG
jgi:Alpha-L-arabinofuranosidase C-terminal domain